MAPRGDGCAPGERARGVEPDGDGSMAGEAGRTMAPRGDGCAPGEGARGVEPDGEGGTAVLPPPAETAPPVAAGRRHPRELRVFPRSRDFH
jgi:hypothetical protein